MAVTHNAASWYSEDIQKSVTLCSYLMVVQGFFLPSIILYVWVFSLLISCFSYMAVKYLVMLYCLYWDHFAFKRF